MPSARYLIFGDLHGRILPAFALALRWERDHGTRLDGLLQVGDLGYFPDPSRLDKATARHAADDPLELGTFLVVAPNPEADRLLLGDGGAPPLWFTAGNHEDFIALAELEQGAGHRASSFTADAYGLVRGIRDGRVEELPGPLRVGALWGIDDEAPNARRGTPERARIRASSVNALGAAAVDVLLSHDGPRDAVLPGSGSEGIGLLIACARPSFAFFGHYGHRHGRIDIGDSRGRTEVYELAGFELRRRGGCAEAGSVGLLSWDDGAGAFEYLDESWLRGFTRHNWRHL